MARDMRIVVAGAGAIGLASALVLARRGHAVTVADPGGASASAVAAGMLAPAFEAAFDEVGRYALFKQAHDLWPAFAADCGLELTSDGAMAVGDRAEAERWASALAAAGAAGRLLAPAEARALCPTLAEDLWGALAAEDWRIYARGALAAMRAAAEAFGARFLEDRVVGWSPGAARLAAGATLAAERLVVATGADRRSRTLAPELAALTPIKGQILRLATDAPAQPTLRRPGVYLCVGEGTAILGATMEAGRDDADIAPAATARLLARAGPLAPSLARADGWRADAGVRAATPDGLPLVGDSKAAGVILAVGARRNGWLLAPLTAAAIRDLVEERPLEGPAAAFDPARFTRDGR